MSPVLNDFGDAGYQRVTQQLDAFAAKLGIPKEIIRQFWSDTAHLPQTLDELKAWGMKPDREYGQVRYDQATGRWNPLGQGPTPGKTDLERGGFPHFINNNVGDAQRFQQVDASGNIFGGSWDPTYNAAHPELAGRSAAGLADDPNARQQIQGRAFDQGNYVGPSGVGFVSVVNGVPNQFGSQAEAENDYNQRTGGGSAQGAPSAGPTAPGGAGAVAPPSPAAPAASAAGAAGGVGFNPAAAAAANAGILAWLAQRRLDEIDKPEFALKTQTELAQMRRDDAAEAWKELYQKAELTGTIDGQPTVDVGKATGNINGTPTLEATKQGADLTGFTGPGYAAQAQAAFERLPPEQRTADAAARIWGSVAPGLTPDEAAQVAQAGHEYYAATGQVMPDAVAAQHLSRITGGRVTGTGAQATPAFQHQQNQDALSALTLLSNLRGPENAFAYANTLANLPDSVRSTIGAAMQTLPLTARNPAQAGLIGDVTGRPAMGQPATQPGGPTQQGGPALIAAPGVGGMPVTGPRITAPTSGVGEVRQQIQGGAMRMDPATQARIGVPAATQTGTPALVAAPGVGTPFGNARAGGTPAAATGPMGTIADRMGAAPTQTGLPSMVAAPGVGGAPGAPTQHAGPALIAAPGIGGAMGGLPVYGPRSQPLRPAAPAGLPQFSQLSPTDWGRTNSYARQLVLAGYEQNGQDKNAILDEFRRRLPTATGPRTGRLRVA